MLARLLELLGRLKPLTLVSLGVAGGSISMAILFLVVVGFQRSTQFNEVHAPGSEREESQEYPRDRSDRDAEISKREQAEPAAPAPRGTPPPPQDSRTLQIFYATNRKIDRSGARPDYTSGRADELSFGITAVRVPENHHEGGVERRWHINIMSFEIGRSEDPKKDFILQGVQELDHDAFVDTIKNAKRDTALVFVHGYNNSFEDGVFRIAQIVWDGQLFEAVPVLFSWPSRANVKDYFYDEGSAELSVDGFVDLLQALQEQAGIKRVHIVAHSMGNRIVLNAMAAAAERLKPRPLGEVVFAAPDVDRDVFVRFAQKLRSAASAMTLYASAADRPLGLKGWLASMPRAGDVTVNGPVIVRGVESIDMTVMGDDLLALNHSTFSASPVVEDLARLVKPGRDPRHPPSLRTPRIRPVPERAVSPMYWRYAN